MPKANLYLIASACFCLLALLIFGVGEFADLRILLIPAILLIVFLPLRKDWEH